MKPAEDALGSRLDALLQEGLALTGELFELQGRVRQGLISGDPVGLVRAMDFGCCIGGLAARLLEHRQRLTGAAPLRAFVELQPESVRQPARLARLELLLEQLAQVRAQGRASARLCQAGRGAIGRFQSIVHAAQAAGYDSQGGYKAGPARAGHGLNENC